MIIPLFLKRQQINLNKRKNELLERRAHVKAAPVKGVADAFSSAKCAGDLYNNYTKTFSGWLKSFIYIPFVEKQFKEYTVRKACAYRLSQAHHKLDQVEKAIKNGKPLEKPVHKKQIKKSYSDSEDAVQRKQYNRLFLPIRIVNEAEDVAIRPKVAVLKHA